MHLSISTIPIVGDFDIPRILIRVPLWTTQLEGVPSNSGFNYNLWREALTWPLSTFSLWFFDVRTLAYTWIVNKGTYGIANYDNSLHHDRELVNICNQPCAHDTWHIHIDSGWPALATGSPVKRVQNCYHCFSKCLHYQNCLLTLLTVYTPTRLLRTSADTTISVRLWGKPRWFVFLSIIIIVTFASNIRQCNALIICHLPQFSRAFGGHLK